MTDHLDLKEEGRLYGKLIEKHHMGAISARDPGNDVDMGDLACRTGVNFCEFQANRGESEVSARRARNASCVRGEPALPSKMWVTKMKRAQNKCKKNSGGRRHCEGAMWKILAQG